MKKNIILNNTSIRDAAREMDLRNINSLAVINSKKKVVGVFTIIL